MDDIAFGEDRYELLAQLAGLADSDHARGKMLRIWRAARRRRAHVLPEEVVAVFLPPAAVVGAELGERVAGGVRIRGAHGRIPVGPRAVPKTYVVRRGGAGGPVKIGRAVDVGLRLAALQTASPEPLELMTVLDGDRETELHAELERFRIGGEWFDGSTAFVADLENLLGALS